MAATSSTFAAGGGIDARWEARSPERPHRFRGAASVVSRPSSAHDPARPVEDLAVGFDRSTRNPSALAQVADHIPVQAGFVAVAGFRVPGPHRAVEGAADLLIEEGVAREIGDGVVGADRDLAEVACAFVLVEHLDQELLVLGGGCF